MRLPRQPRMRCNATHMHGKALQMLPSTEHPVSVKHLHKSLSATRAPPCQHLSTLGLVLVNIVACDYTTTIILVRANLTKADRVGKMEAQGWLG